MSGPVACLASNYILMRKMAEASFSKHGLSSVALAAWQ